MLRNTKLKNLTVRKERRQRIRDLLIAAYKQMSELTAPLCGKCPRMQQAVNRCCDKRYCEMAIQIAKKDWGVTLKPTGHSIIPLMGPDGCTAEPHFRPLCTLHNCQINAFGYTLNSKWDKKYFDLRSKINTLQFRLEELK
jgi:hypothetical protein